MFGLFKMALLINDIVNGDDKNCHCKCKEKSNTKPTISSENLGFENSKSRHVCNIQIMW